MWSVHGRIAFVAEEAGATAVTGVDVMGETPEYQAEHAARDSGVRFVQGDLHDPSVLDAAGRHDVVWCSGVLYHSPNPVLTLERLRSVCGETLLLATEVLPGADHAYDQRERSPVSPLAFDAGLRERARGAVAAWLAEAPR